MHYLFAFALLSFVFFSSCQKKDKAQSLIYTSLEYIDNEIIDSFPKTALNKKLLFNKHEQLINNAFYSVDRSSNIIYKYEIGKSNFEEVLKLDFDLRILDYYIDKEGKYHSFVLDDELNDVFKLKVIDFQGKTLVEKPIPNHTDYVLSARFPHIFLNGKDFYAGSGAKLLNYPPEYTQKYIEMHWDINNDVIDILPIAFPNNYHGKFWGIHYVVDRVAINDSLHAFSFYFNDSIFIYNINSRKISAHYAGTQQNYMFPDIKIEERDLYHKEVQMDISMNAAFYFQLSYLPKNGMYLRHFRNNEQEISQILYDKDFNYIGEVPINNYKSFYDTDKGFLNIITSDSSYFYVERYNIRAAKNMQWAQINTKKYLSYRERYLKENFDAGVQGFLERTKLIPAKNDSIIIYQSTHCSSCVKSSALNFLKEKDNKNTTIIVFDEKDKEMLASHIFLSPIVLCQDNSLSEEGYYHHMPHLYFWKGDKVTSSPIVKEKEEEENI